MQTAKATEEIAGQIQAVQASSESAVNAIQRITNRMKDINEHTASIAASVGQQSAVTSEISQNVTKAAGSEGRHGRALSGDQCGDENQHFDWDSVRRISICRRRRPGASDEGRGFPSKCRCLTGCSGHTAAVVVVHFKAGRPGDVAGTRTLMHRVTVIGNTSSNPTLRNELAGIIDIHFETLDQARGPSPAYQPSLTSTSTCARPS